ncbi:hypothetical protein DI09_7p40 [Mitosporidium daphniae]|uniref:Uncharacterized protein n=1 Tax=Mitosporidium daphniae TaxID=1485682 RepID=A0A098VMM8_9MICR|nr:uncharacterized protein DI09_7p40 [Mitosporidium daphniae]KGG50225.1 hypothetical protein DI09_7p40 [Mitosporidium daphniae]|eukprot:XP_013236708.1 uncharacterized protein DI09_7p40 [Mitosporidium daphniae]
MRILDQVETLSMETLSTFDPLFREMVLFGYCNFASALEAENASDETIKSRLQKFKSAIGRFHPSCSDIDDEEHDGNDVIGKACTPTSPMLFPQHSNFEILQVFISCQFSVLQDSESHWTLRSNTLAASALAEPICADASCAALVLSCSSTANVPIPSMHNGACFASSLYHGTVINVLCLGSATGCTPAETSLAIFSKLHV